MCKGFLTPDPQPCEGCSPTFRWETRLDVGPRRAACHTPFQTLISYRDLSHFTI